MNIENIEIFGFGLEEKLPLIGVSIWNIIMFLVVLLIGIIVVKIAAGLLKKWMLKAKVSEILSEFTTRIIRLILYVFVIEQPLLF